MKNKLNKSVISLLMLFAIQPCNAEPLNQPVQRIVSLAPSVTETLFALGVGDRVVAVTRYCKYPPQAQLLPQIGGYYDPNYEAIVSFQPDLVIFLKEHEQARDYLNALGIKHLQVDNQRVSGILNAITTIGEKVGKKAQAEVLLNGIKKDFNRIKTLTKGAPEKRVLVTIGRPLKPGPISSVYVVGHEDFYTPLLKLAHAKNAYQGSIPFPVLSTEGILQLKPDVIIDITTGSAATEKNKHDARQQWLSTFPSGSLKSSQIHILMDDKMLIPGPRVNLIANALAQAIHPELDWSNDAAK